MKNKIFILFTLCLGILTHLNAQLQLGDPGVTFDTIKFDSDYPQMQRWSETGVRGGIPFIDELDIVLTLDPTSSTELNAAIESVSNEGGGTIKLLNGNYDIKSEVYMKSNVNLLGESRDGVKCIVNFTSGNAFLFETISSSGIYNLTIEGSWGTPKYNWNTGVDENDELPDNSNVSVRIKDDASDCWLDQVNIINSARHPLIIGGSHNTIRSCKINGVFKKAGGYQGYFHIAGPDNLVVNNYVTHLRHISIQGDGAGYNVVYNNIFDQELSFHNDDDGNNLIENNKITLPSGMPGEEGPNYYAIMGPWSDKHTISKTPNFIYKNSCLELNSGHNNATPWSVTNIVYYGPHEVKPADPHTNFTTYSGGNPLGNTLYPVLLGEGYKETFENMTLADWGTETYTGDSNFVWNIDAKGVSGLINANKGIYFHSGNIGVISSTIPSGISSFNVICKDIEDVDSQRKLELLINGVVVDSIKHIGPELYNFTVNNINISGDITIAVKNASGASLNNAVAIDNISWHSFADVTSVNISPDSISLFEGQSQYLSKQVLPVSASDKSVTWSSMDVNTATVDSEGYVTAVKKGAVKIVVKSNNNNFTDTCVVIVNSPILVTSVSVSPNDLSLYVGQTEQLTATVLPVDATYNSVVWSCSDTTIAKVDKNGLVRAITEGDAVIIATSADGNFKDSCLLSISTLGGEAIYTETFEKMTHEGWGEDITFTGDNGFEWTLNAKGTSGWIDDTKCIYMQSFGKKETIGITSAVIPGGISSFSVQCRDLWSVGTKRTLQLLINDVVVGSIDHTGEEEYTFTVDSINKPGDITIAIKNSTPYDDANEENNSVAIDNITWITYSGTGNSKPEINDQTFSVKENSANETIVGIVVASDVDVDQTHSYSIVGGNTKNIFGIDAASGELKVVDNTLLDYETDQVIELLVKVKDSGVFPESNTATITINIEDVEDGIGVNDDLNLVSIYPNPFTSSLIVEVENAEYLKAVLMDISGKIIMTQSLIQDKEVRFSPSYSEAPAGLYILQMISNKEVNTIKVIRE